MDNLDPISIDESMIIVQRRADGTERYFPVCPRSATAGPIALASGDRVSLANGAAVDVVVSVLLAPV